MRTKALLGLAAFAVSAATCVAQGNVYSLNIVGYVNVDIKQGLNLISNPLKPSNGNYNITNTIVLPDTADGALIYKWNKTAWASDVPQWIAGLGWTPDLSMELGEAFFLSSPVATKVTFVGEVATGPISYSYPSGFNAVANKVPVEEAFPGAATAGNDGDIIYKWTGSAWDASWSFIAGLGWTGGTPDNPKGPTLKVGEGIMYQNTGTAPVAWTRNFDPNTP